MKFITLVLLYLFNYSISSKNFKIPYKKMLDSYRINIRLGDPLQSSDVELDLGIDYMWISNFFYSVDKSFSFSYQQNANFFFFTKTINCQSIQDDIVFSPYKEKDITVNHFPFYEVNKEDSNGYQSIGLGYNSSLLSQFKNMKLIIKRQFSFYQINYLDGFILFGELEEENKKEYPYKASCSVKNSTWGCQLSNVLFKQNNKSIIDYENDNIAFFNSKIHNIKAPKKFIVFLRNHLFNEYIDNRVCNYFQESSFENFECTCDIVDKFPDISLVFDGGVFNINRNLLFKKISGICSFNIKKITMTIIGKFVHFLLSNILQLLILMKDK